MADEKNWIVMSGQPVDTVHGGGFEFFGPFTEEEAERVRRRMLEVSPTRAGQEIVLAVQLLHYRIPDTI